MEQDLFFSEKQKFRQWWLWAILIGTNIIFLCIVIGQLMVGRLNGSSPETPVDIILVFFLSVLMTLLFFNFRLETRIKKDGIHVRFFPFHLKFKYYSWDDILHTEVRTYNPIGEYGGWGLRGIGKNRAFNISGNQGLQLEFKDHKKLLIGTRQPEAILKALEQVQKNKT